MNNKDYVAALCARSEELEAKLETAFDVLKKTVGWYQTARRNYVNEMTGLYASDYLETVQRCLDNLKDADTALRVNLHNNAARAQARGLFINVDKKQAQEYLDKGLPTVELERLELKAKHECRCFIDLSVEKGDGAGFYLPIKENR